MHHYSYSEILELSETEPDKSLRLHWEGGEGEPKQVNPCYIVSDVEEGEYTPEEFDSIGYCVSEEDFLIERD